jgi:predicted protein tyrosine phosphatase
MNQKIISTIIIFSLITVIPTVYGQLGLGAEANQKSIEVFIDKSENVNVKHTVYSSNNPANVPVFFGIIEDSLKITNDEGIEIEFGRTGNDVEGITSLLIFASKENTIIEYSLTDVKTLDNNLWSLNLEYPKTFSIIINNEINSIFLNNNLIELGNKNGIAINGGGSINLQHYANVPITIKEVEWEENKFNVEIISNSEIQKFNFNQEEKSITFQIDDENEFVTITMSEELLGGPYVVLLDNEKIQYNLVKNESTISLNLKPQSTGQVTIIGTTVIPEFSMFIPLIMGFMIILTVPLMKKFSLR